MAKRVNRGPVADVNDKAFTHGPIALSQNAGTTRQRKVVLKTLSSASGEPHR